MWFSFSFCLFIALLPMNSSFKWFTVWKRSFPLSVPPLTHYHYHYHYHHPHYCTTLPSDSSSTPPTSPTPSTTPSTTTSTTTTTTPSPFPLLPDIYEDLSPNKDQSLLKYKLRIGKGKNGYPLQHDEVEIGYRIYGRNHSLLFDSMEYEMENKEFFRCHLNMQPSEILPGWEIALKTMFEGEKSMYYLASQHAFGPAGGLPPFIRADEDVYCELTLHKIIPSLARQYGTVREGEDIKQELVNQIMRGEIRLDGPEDSEGNGNGNGSGKEEIDVDDLIDNEDDEDDHDHDDGNGKGRSMKEETLVGEVVSTPQYHQQEEEEEEYREGQTFSKGFIPTAPTSSSSDTADYSSSTIPSDDTNTDTDAVSTSSGSGNSGNSGNSGSNAKNKREAKFFDPTRHREDPNLTINGEGAGHDWEEGRGYLEVHIALPIGVTSKHHFTVKLLPNEIVIRRREEEGKEGEGEGEVILSGPLHGRIVPSECSWAVEDGEKQQVGEEGIGKVLVLHLEKAHGHRDIWATVFSRSYLRKKAKEEKKRLESTLQQGQGDEGGIKKEEEDDDEEEEEE